MQRLQAAAAAESAYHMEHKWLQESVTRAKERLRIQHAVEARASERLIKELRAEHKKRLKDIAKQEHEKHQVLLKQRLAETNR